jgi:hypothetical protein
MEISAYVFTETLRVVCNLTLFFDIFARLTYWFGAENTGTGAFLRSVSDMISYPFARLLSKFVERHPFFDRLPNTCGTLLVFMILLLLP